MRPLGTPPDTALHGLVMVEPQAQEGKENPGILCICSWTDLSSWPTANRLGA